MNTEVSSGRVRQNKNKSSGGIPLTAFMAGLVLLSSGASHAADSPAANAGAAGDGPASAASTADGSVAELQAEVARLKKALEKSQKELAEHLGHPANVVSLCWGGSGLDFTYFVVRDLLERRRVRLQRLGKNR